MEKQRKKLLVTGLSGMVGSRFQSLFGGVYECINLDLTAGIDITKPDQVESVFSDAHAAAVIHLAAFTNVNAAFDQTNDKQGVCYAVNVVGTQTIARAAAKHHLHLIHVSTDFVFDGTKDLPYVETDIPHPIEWYGKTKYMAEEEVEESGAAYTILRMSYPYQAHPMRPDFLQKMMDNLKANTLPPAFTDHVITPTFVDDVAHVFDYCVQHQPVGLYHMVGSSSHTDYEIASMVKEIFQLPGDVKEGSLEAYLKTINRPYQRTMRISNNKLVSEFGIKMRTLRDGLAEIKQQLNA
jgi:dTDP-4-dehydrorhamnose reductase